MAKNCETNNEVSKLVGMPGADFYARVGQKSQKLAASLSASEMVFLGRAMEQALLARDLAAFERLASDGPSCLFATFGSTKAGDSTWGNARSACDTLATLPEDFAFSVGKVWAGAVAANKSEGCLASARELVGRALESTLSARGASIAFACGMASAEGMEDFRAWMGQVGKTAQCARREFGAAEYSIWGKAWGSKASQDNMDAQWCATVLVQAVLRGAQGREAEMEALAGAASGLKAPAKGWMKRALDEGEVRFENESRALDRVAGGGFYNFEGAWLGKPYVEAKLLEVESLCARICAMGPDSWAKNGVVGLNGPAAARVEKAILAGLSKQWADGASAGAKRI
jgi:hypothetical protein